MEKIKEIAKSGNVKAFTTCLKKLSEEGTPLGTTSLHTPAPDIPNFQVRLADCSVTGQGYRAITSEIDRINFCRYLIRHDYLSDEILAKAQELEREYLAKQEEIKKQHEIEELQRNEKRKRNFTEIKSLWTTRYAPPSKIVYDKIKNLNEDQKRELLRQVKAGEIPSRMDSEDCEQMIVFIEALLPKESTEDARTSLSKLVATFRGH